MLLLGTCFLSLEAMWAQKVLRLAVLRGRPREARAYPIYNVSFFSSPLFLPAQHVASPGEAGFSGDPGRLLG